MEPDELLNDMAETYRQKNEDYGDSWRVVGHLIWKMADEEPILLASPRDVNRIGLYTRRLDKMKGAFHGEFVRAEDFTFEDALNRHADEGTYAAMHASDHADEPAEDESEPEGLYDKYTVFEDGEHVDDAFVLRPGTDPAARRALEAYANATDDEALASDIRDWIVMIESGDVSEQHDDGDPS